MIGQHNDDDWVENNQPNDNEEEEGEESEDEAAAGGTSLQWKNRGVTYQFQENPMRFCVWILLLLRAVERGIYYGFLFINPGFLTGECMLDVIWLVVVHSESINDLCPFLISTIR